MSAERRLEALSQFSELVPPPESAEVAAARRRRVVGSIASTMRSEAAAQRARQRRGRIAWTLSAAAVIALGLGAAWRLGGSSHGLGGVIAGVPPARLVDPTGGVIVTHEGRAQAVAADVPLVSDDEVTTTPDANARLLLESGATVEVAQATRLRVPASAKRQERVRLGVGEIVVRVPKLGAGESFRVETPDAEVIVHGTSFVVTVRDGKTGVVVREGVVSVKTPSGETFLHAGDTWPASTTSVTPEVPTNAETNTPVEATDTTPALANPSAVSPHGPRPETSTLREQNRLLQQALDARRRGDDEHAIENLDRLLTRYPSSPLGQEARVEKFRALERRRDHARAVAEARRYLAEYPTGFAANEAKALISR